MIQITGALSLNDDEIDLSFIRASGPGGQNVNKVSTAVRLRFDVRRSPSLPEPVRTRLESLAGQRLSRDGVLQLTAQRFRSQERNRLDAVERLIALIRQAAATDPPRRPTRPTLASKHRRLDAKLHTARVKSLRTRPQE